MRGVWSSVADLAVVQAQDVLGLGHEARMNTPATLGGNWCWRAPARRLYPRSWPKSCMTLWSCMAACRKNPLQNPMKQKNRKTQKKRRNPKPDLSLSNAPPPEQLPVRGLFANFWVVALATDGPDAGWYTKGTLQGMLNQQPGRAGMKNPDF